MLLNIGKKKYLTFFNFYILKKVKQNDMQSKNSCHKKVPEIKSSQSKLYFSINEAISFNEFHLTENYPSKALFEALEPSFDDEDAKIWEDNTWRIEYFSFLKEKNYE